MINNRLFFEVPIYRCSPEEYEREHENALQKQLLTLGVSREEAPERYQRVEEIYSRNYRYCYYNDLIGWLQLSILAGQIRGQYFLVDAKRIPKNMKNKNFVYYDKAFDMSVWPEDSSDVIFQKLRNELFDLSKQAPIKKRHLDLEAFDRIGRFVDWRALLRDRA